MDEAAAAYTAVLELEPCSVAASYNLAWNIGTKYLTWTLYNGTTQQNCGSAGLTNVNRLQNPQRNSQNGTCK